jgi:2-polyprenyl-3-methyl-5-hydroxy-6-metoxy-1,4-benzoquinol methylase
VLAAVGPLDLPPGAQPAQLGAQAAAPLQQISAVLGGRLDAWMQLPDEALIAQGEASGQLAPAFQHFLLPQLPGLGEALARDGARMLDVGTGVGAIARGFAATFPALHVTGLDVSSRVLEIGATLLADSPVRDRVEFREQSVADLDEPGAYDLVWMPAPFVPAEPLREGLARCVKALRPGGCVCWATAS